MGTERHHMTDTQTATLAAFMARLYPRCRARGGTLADTITMAATIAADTLKIPLTAATAAAREVAAHRHHP